MKRFLSFCYMSLNLWATGVGYLLYTRKGNLDDSSEIVASRGQS